MPALNLRAGIPFRKEDVVWWELFPIRCGDRVRIISTGRVGVVRGMTIPMSHSGKLDINVEKHLRQKYHVVCDKGLHPKDLGSKNFEVNGLFRWEIEKIGTEKSEKD